MEITGDTMPKVEQEVRRNYQLLKVMYYLGLIISERN